MDSYSVPIFLMPKSCKLQIITHLFKQRICNFNHCWCIYAQAFLQIKYIYTLTVQHCKAQRDHVFIGYMLLGYELIWMEDGSVLIILDFCFWTAGISQFELVFQPKGCESDPWQGKI